MNLTNEQRTNLFKLIDLLEKYKFYYNEEDIKYLIENNQPIELVRKAYGDSYSCYTEEVFGNDYNELVRLARSINIKIPNEVWYD